MRDNVSASSVQVCEGEEDEERVEKEKKEKKKDSQASWKALPRA